MAIWTHLNVASANSLAANSLAANSLAANSLVTEEACDRLEVSATLDGSSIIVLISDCRVVSIKVLFRSFSLAASGAISRSILEVPGS